ncbi:MAG: hypothetical protein QOH89_3701 [Pseudonocardiales bacterium]|nr:hypothetical protein [Pseudonocardiales bacterium]
MRRRDRDRPSRRGLSLRTRLLVATIGLAATGITASVLLRGYLVQRVTSSSRSSSVP